MRVVVGDQLHDALVLARRREVEVGPLQAPARRVGVDAEKIADPVLLLEVGGHPAAQIAAHSGDEHTPSCHSPQP